MGSPTRERWATFDCYGTLIDWNGGIAGELGRLFGAEEAPRLLARYHELEPQVQVEDPELTYRRVLTLTLEQIAECDLIAASKAQIGVPFDETIVASEIGSYKPGHRHWSEFFARTHVDRAGHVHVAASLFHDVVPCAELGLRSVWVNRLGETADPVPTKEITDLSGLADVLDQLVPA